MPSWVLCEDCHRVLLAEHGPVCPECLAKRADEEPTDWYAGLSHQPTPAVKPVNKRKVAEPADDTERVQGCCP